MNLIWVIGRSAWGSLSCWKAENGPYDESRHINVAVTMNNKVGMAKKLRDKLPQKIAP